MGVCDCCQKHASDIEMFALETIPIASRMGLPTSLFSDIAGWAKRIQGISSVEQVQTVKFDEEYMLEAGAASGYRKQIERMISESRGSQSSECPECATLKELSQEYQKQREGRGK